MNWLFPLRCLACRAFSKQIFCGDCAAGLPLLEPPYCDRCALPFIAGGSHRCGGCLEQPPSFDAVIAWGRYEGAVADLIARLKYRKEEKVAPHFGRLLVGRLLTGRHTDRAEYDQVVSVPLDRRRLRKRGFNQAVLIAREVGRQLRIAFDPFLLEKRGVTESQMGLPREERLRNLREAFAVNPRRRVAQKILLVDDVMTTGATAEACARALKKAGAERVDVAVVARTPL